MKCYDWNLNNKKIYVVTFLNLRIPFLLGYKNASLDNREGAAVLGILNPCR
jgi:hypothetical protein